MVVKLEKTGIHPPAAKMASQHRFIPDVLMLPLCGGRVLQQRGVTYLHVSVDFLHELLLLLLRYVHLLHVVPEVHVLEGRKLLSLQE